MFYDISRCLTDKYFDIVWGCHPQGPPKWTPQKSIFFTAQARLPVCFDISRYLTDKYFDIVWGCYPSPEIPPKQTPQKSNQIFHYTRCNTPKCVTTWRGPSPCQCAWATQLLLKKFRSGGETLAILCPI